MTKPREELQALLEKLLGSRNVYFQPPENLKLQYPCIVYELSDMPARYADNAIYDLNRRYMLTLIDKDPEPKALPKVRELRFCSFDRFYIADNLNHFVFSVYY